MEDTRHINTKSLFKMLIFASWFLLYPIISIAQSSNNWIDSFSQSDKTRIENLNQLNIDEDIKILGITNSLINDTIVVFINTSEIDNSIPNILKTKKQNLNELIEIYDLYLNGSKSSIDSIGVYASNVNINIDFVNQYKSELSTMLSGNTGTNKEQALALMKYIQTQENIIFNQKQFFTFYSLSGNNHLINSGTESNNESIVEPVSSQHTTEEHSSKEPISTNQTEVNTPINTQNGSSENFKYANVIINEEIVESIKVSLSEYEEDTNEIFNITSYDVESLANTWDSYVYPEEPKPEKDTIPIVEEIKDTIEFIEEEPIAVYEPVQETFTPEIPETNTLFTANENSEPEIESTFTSSITGLVYRVQIAASYVQLSSNKLNKIYSGDKQIKMFEEEGWYKYYIAETKTLKEAIIIKKESDVADAFVMAYKDGEKVQFYLQFSDAAKGSKPPDNFIDLKSLSDNKVIIVVQVAADEEPLSRERLNELYQGGKPLNYIYENGWHKYSFGNYDRFWPANFARRECGTEGAFVVAYKNGKKYNLWSEENKE